MNIASAMQNSMSATILRLSTLYFSSVVDQRLFAFNTLVLLAECREGHMACNNYHYINYQRCSWGPLGIIC